jgi:HAD superfamily hydrolase (TIGR01509 family)
VQKEFFGGDVVDYNLVSFIRSLRPQYKVGAISNAWSGLRGYMERDKFDDAFDAIICSADVGAAKPDPKIYQIALDQLHVKANEAVFVDDILENIEACQRLGMKGIHFREAEAVIRQLKTIL